MAWGRASIRGSRSCRPMPTCRFARGDLVTACGSRPGGGTDAGDRGRDDGVLLSLEREPRRLGPIELRLHHALGGLPDQDLTRLRPLRADLLETTFVARRTD